MRKQITEPEVIGGQGLLSKVEEGAIINEYKEELKHRLLKYCKLDTMAMVIIWLYWKKNNSIM